MTTHTMQLFVVPSQTSSPMIVDTVPSQTNKRKPELEQQQELQRKQHRRMLDGGSNMYNCNNYNYNFGNNQKQQAKMYYNSNARQFWARAPIALTNITITTTATTTTAATSAAAKTKFLNEQQTSALTEAAAVTYDKMQRYNNTGNSNNNNNSGGKRCTQKYANGNIAAGTTAGNATAATAATAAATVANSYQQTNSNSNNNNNNSGSKSNNATRKARYNNHNSNNNNKRHEAGNAAYNLQQKRSNVVAAGADAQSWHRFVTSSCIEEKFLGQHNPGHRNSTSSEATSEDINSSDEHSGKSKSNRSGANGGSGSGSGSGNNAAAGGGNNNSGSGGKSRSKRQQKAQSALKQSLNRTPAMVPGQVQGQQSQQVQQPLEQQATAKASGKCSSSSKQGKWRNSASSCNSGANQKRGSSGSNKSKQTKGGNGKPAGSSSNNHHSGSNHNSNNHHHSSNSNVNSLTKSSGNYSSSSSSGGSNSSSALSSPGSSPNSSSSGNSSSHSLNSTAATSSWSRNHQHKIYRQNANFLVPPLRQYEHIELDDAALQQQLQRYLIEPHLLRVYGFPVESVVHEGAIEIFKCLPHMSFAAAHCMAVTETVMTVINCHDGLNTNNFEEEPTSSSSLSGSSGNEASTSTDSGNISPRSLDSESAGEWSGSECESSNELYCNYDATPEEERSLAKQCVRCKQDFLVDELSGQYLTRDECSYHWGKYHRCYDGSAWVSRWTCCSSSDESDIGCTRHELHVWTGSVVGVNGPYRDFVHTRPRTNSNGQTQTRAVYALDCEMSYTGRGLDVTKVSLVALNGQLVYEHYVRPDADIVDYNTRYSGVTAKDLKSCGVKTLAEVQRDLLELIDADTILIGHGLDNDLRALRLVHNTLIDTSIAFPHSSGFPYRRALRHLTKTHLNREIQSGDGATGHSSFEDSRACMELMLWRVRCELDSDGSWED